MVWAAHEAEHADSSCVSVACSRLFGVVPGIITCLTGVIYVVGSKRDSNPVSSTTSNVHNVLFHSFRANGARVKRKPNPGKCCSYSLLLLSCFCHPTICAAWASIVDHP